MAATSYTIDTSHSSIGFSVRHMVFAKVRGHFDKWEGSFQYDEQDPSHSSVEVKVETASVDTRDEKRDGHLKSADFFDVEKNPNITFKSKKVERAGAGLRIAGDLSMHGVTREVTLQVESLGQGKDPWGNMRVAFSATTTVDRGDFGLKWNQPLDTGGVLVGEKVEITIDLEATKKA